MLRTKKEKHTAPRRKNRTVTWGKGKGKKNEPKEGEGNHAVK